MSPPSISIVIATMGRPRMLEQLLTRLDGQLLGSPEPEVELVIVDNDPAQLARPACERYQSGGRFPLRYVVEPRRGIPFARNTGIESVPAGRDFVIFVDDDELPEPGWLVELLRVQRACDADVVSGPIESILPANAPRWATAGKIFAHRRFRTGTSITWCGTCNVLVRTRVFAELHPWFDVRLALSGGSDRYFFRRVHAAGFRCVWADEALVREEVPATRVQLAWVMRRMYRQGLCNAFCEVELDRNVWTRARLTLLGLGWIGLGVVLAPFGIVLGSHRLVQFVRYVVYGAGLIAGVHGHLYQEYATIHGD